MTVVRLTKQRQAILEAMRTTNTHPDAAWVHAEVRKKIPKISLATVYRTLESLVEEGHLVAISSGRDACRFDFKHDPHHHGICKHCGHIFDIPADPHHTVVLPSQLPLGFTVENIVFELHGICEHCQSFKGETPIVQEPGPLQNHVQ